MTPPLDSFEHLGLSEKVISAIKSVGYTVPTPIQKKTIPHVLQKKDVLGIAQTGTGKTASFVLPMLTLLEKGRTRTRMPRILILEPTRELTIQVKDNFDKYGVNHCLNVALLIGGVPFEHQDRKLEQGADVLIATPGRLLDHFKRGKLLLTGVEILVIDEADHMLDIGFIPDIKQICKLTPFTRQTLFFSATMAPEITKITEKFLHSPVCIEVTKESSPAQTISQWFVKSGSEAWNKRAVLRKLIHDEGDQLKSAIIFCNRKKDISELLQSLIKRNFSAGALHSGMDQYARMNILENFRNNKITLLVASDVAARGLDIPAVSHVFNYDVPTHAEDYIHRIGRTGRAERTGKAFTIVTKADQKYISSIEKISKDKIIWLDETPSSSMKNKRTDHTAFEKKSEKLFSKSTRKYCASPTQKSPPKTDSRFCIGTVNRKRNLPDPSDHEENQNRTPLGFGDNIPAFMYIKTRG